MIFAPTITQKQARPYQEAAINDITNSDKNTVIIAPTGTGKTLILSESIRKLSQKGKRIFLLLNRTEFVAQTEAELSGMGLRPSILTADRTELNNPFVVIAMTYTLKSRINQPTISKFVTNADYIFIDECHYGDHKWLYEHAKTKDKLRIGFTATPVSSTPKEPLNLFFDRAFEAISPKEALKQGYNVPAQHLVHESDLSELQVSSTGEYTEASQERVFRTAKIFRNIIDLFRIHAAKTNDVQSTDNRKLKKTIIFCPSQNTAADLQSRLNSLGHNFALIVSGNDTLDKTAAEERARIVKSLADPTDFTYTGVVNVATLTAGVDIPPCELVILNYATLSIAKYIQTVGRGARLCHPIGKTHFTVIDLGGNFTRFGLFGNYWLLDKAKNRIELDWVDYFNSQTVKKSTGEVPMKHCPECDAQWHMSIKVCKSIKDIDENGNPTEYCGYEFPATAKEIIDDANFVLLQGDEYQANPKWFSWTWDKAARELSVIDLIRYQKHHKYPDLATSSALAIRGLILQYLPHSPDSPLVTLNKTANYAIERIRKTHLQVTYSDQELIKAASAYALLTDASSYIANPDNTAAEILYSEFINSRRSLLSESVRAKFNANSSAFTNLQQIGKQLMNGYGFFVMEAFIRVKYL